MGTPARSVGGSGRGVVCRSRGPGRRRRVTATHEKNPAGASASVRTRRIRQTAEGVLGFTDFRAGQNAAMPPVAGGRHTLAVLPSGTGKSAVHAVAGLLLDGPVVIISPLIAL